MARNEYITDPKVLREARRANRLFTSAQEDMGIALDCVGFMADSDFMGPWPMWEFFGRYHADRAIEDTAKFQKIVGEVAVHARTEDVQRLKDFVRSCKKANDLQRAWAGKPRSSY